MLGKMVPKSAELILCWAERTLDKLHIIHRPLTHFEQERELSRLPRSGMFILQMACHVAVGVERLGALLALPLAPMHLHLMVFPLVASRIHLVAVDAFGESTKVGP
jgi:hypothetical protein